MVTRDDVAKHAGVSKTTVSRVLNSNGYVSSENRSKIEQAIKELGYSPDLIARGLKTRESRQILFFVNEILNPFYMEVYRGMEDCAEENGYTIVLSRNFDPGRIRQRRYDGIILSDISPGKEDDYITLGIPAVVTDYGGKPLNIPSVGIDIKGGAMKAAQFLLESGHRKVAFITMLENRDDQRLSGFLNFLDKAGASVSREPVTVVNTQGNNGYAKGYNAAVELLQRTGGDITAVFAFNDTMAIGAMKAFSERDIKLPGDISVMGFDDIIQSGFTTPALTTVRLPKYEQGYESARLLINMLRGHKAESMTLDTELVERDSVIKIKQS